MKYRILAILFISNIFSGICFAASPVTLSFHNDNQHGAQLSITSYPITGNTVTPKNAEVYSGETQPFSINTEEHFTRSVQFKIKTTDEPGSYKVITVKEDQVILVTTPSQPPLCSFATTNNHTITINDLAHITCNN